jgi:hypothetical protein
VLIAVSQKLRTRSFYGGGGPNLQWRTEGTLPRLIGSGDQNVLLLTVCRTVRIFPDVCGFWGGGEGGVCDEKMQKCACCLRHVCSRQQHESWQVEFYEAGY